MKTEKRIILFLIAILCGLSFVSCFKEDFSTNPNDRLSFSTDSVKFDTIFTQKGTATYSFRVYNHNSKALNISSVRLTNGNAGFYINVDGQPGPDLQNIEILGKDSLTVFVKANVDPTGQDTPMKIEDAIIFTTNGIDQKIILEAYGQDAILLRGDTIKVDTEFSSPKPYLIYDSLIIAPDVTLTLKAGTRLHFHNKAELRVKGRLNAEGSVSQPVTFRGDRLDKLFPTLPYDFLAGQWGGIHFYKDSYDNHLDHMSMRGSSYGMVIDSSDISKLKLELSNSVIHNSAGNLFSSTDSQINAWNCQFSNAGNAVLKISGGKAEFTHCTIVNYYRLDIIRSPILTFDKYASTLGDKALNISFKNCIISGSYTLIQPTDLLGFNIHFYNCLFTLGGSDDENFLNCIWEGDPKFYATGDDYIFDYRLSSDQSSAIKAGNPEYLNEQLRTDMLGTLRPKGENPDIGAYQFVPEKTEQENL